MCDNYDKMIQKLRAYSSDISDNISILSNASAIVWEYMKDLNWAGFYFLKGEKLVLGPFQGKPACTVLQVGKGVCGTSVKENRTILVPDVHEFPGHIACDSASNSEIVIPIRINNVIYGVLDIDSPILNRFSEEDRDELEKFVSILERFLGNLLP